MLPSVCSNRCIPNPGAGESIKAPLRPDRVRNILEIFNPPHLRGFCFYCAYSISIILFREVWPRTITIRDFATPKCLASNSMSAVFALPSTAGSRIYTNNDPSSCVSTSGPLVEFGFMVIE